MSGAQEDPPQNPPIGTPGSPSVPPAARQIGLIRNWISLAGSVLILASVVMLITFGFFQASGPTNPYADIIAYMVLPGLLFMGLAAVPAGMLMNFLLLRRKGRTQGLLQVDLTDRRIRRLLTGFSLSTILLVVPAVAVSSYKAYHFTETSEFCGNMCHSAMGPQAVAHAVSPHARVPCADCHIGSGAGWFVKAKLSGTRQVLAVWRNDFPRPIPPAISELRPARDTCEECHWPAKFFGAQYKEFVRYSPDENNSRRAVRLLLKTGGSDEALGRVEGIHAHMALGARIEYVAVDASLQHIPWVRYTDRQGRTRVFRSDEQPVASAPPPGVVRTVDCMDCHNRGAHHFRSPQAMVDVYLNASRIDAGLPFVKREAVSLLTAGYAGEDAARAAIGTELARFYQENYPSISQSKRAEIQQAVEAISEIYGRTFFPDMHVDWRTYPENIGHMYSAGCMRCHDGRHVDEGGIAISSDCTVCHELFVMPNEEDNREAIEWPFRCAMHEVAHGDLPCYRCHTGGVQPTCNDCHEDIAGDPTDSDARL